MEHEESFFGKYFLLTERYWSDRGMWREGFAALVKARVGSDSFLTESCKAGFKQQVVSTEFFTESRALIFDTFEELHEAKEQRYPKKKIAVF